MITVAISDTLVRMTRTAMGNHGREVIENPSHLYDLIMDEVMQMLVTEDGDQRVPFGELAKRARRDREFDHVFWDQVGSLRWVDKEDMEEDYFNRIEETDGWNDKVSENYRSSLSKRSNGRNTLALLKREVGNG